MVKQHLLIILVLYSLEMSLAMYACHTILLYCHMPCTHSNVGDRVVPTTLLCFFQPLSPDTTTQLGDALGLIQFLLSIGLHFALLRIVESDLTLLGIVGSDYNLGRALPAYQVRDKRAETFLWSGLY